MWDNEAHQKDVNVVCPHNKRRLLSKLWHNGSIRRHEPDLLSIHLFHTRRPMHRPWIARGWWDPLSTLIDFHVAPSPCPADREDLRHSALPWNSFSLAILYRLFRFEIDFLFNSVNAAETAFFHPSLQENVTSRYFNPFRECNLKRLPKLHKDI